MKRYSPSIENRSTSELMTIALGDTSTHEADMIESAKTELTKRDISKTDLNSFHKNYKIQTDKKEAQLVENKKTAGFSFWEVIEIIHFFPILIIKYFIYKKKGYENKARMSLLILRVVGLIVLFISGLLIISLNKN